MQNIIILSLSVLVFIGIITIFIQIKNTNNKITEITKTLAFQYNLIVKIQSVLKNKNATKYIFPF